MSTIVRADASGAVTLPAELSQAAGFKPGAELVAEVNGGQIILRPPGPTLAERIAARANDLPPEVLERLPPDGASQHDHYIYGTPKRPE
jgi:antitoxin component of MazEF toxin-antitoxin module